MAEFKAAIEARFRVRHLDGTEFLGLSIEHDRDKGVLEIDQAKYVEKILKRFGYWDCKQQRNKTLHRPKYKSGIARWDYQPGSDGRCGRRAPLPE